MPLQEVLQLAHEVGIDGIEPWGKPDHLPLTTPDEQVRETRRATSTNRRPRLIPSMYTAMAVVRGSSPRYSRQSTRSKLK